MRIVQGRGGPQILVPPLREAELRRRRIRASARLTAALLLGAAAAITARAMVRLSTADQPVQDVLLAWHSDYVIVPIMLLGFFVALRRERLGGILLVVSTIAWLILARGGEIPDAVLLLVAVGVAVAGGCFIWLGGGSH